MLNIFFKCFILSMISDEIGASEAGRLKLVNALAHRGRGWTRLTYGQAQVLACADLLACGPVAL